MEIRLESPESLMRLMAGFAGCRKIILLQEQTNVCKGVPICVCERERERYMEGKRKERKGEGACVCVCACV